MAGTCRRNRPPRKLITVDRAPTTAKPEHPSVDRHHSTEIQHQRGGCLTSPPVQPQQPTCPNNSLTNPNLQPMSMPKDFTHRHACRDTMHNQRPSTYRLRSCTPRRRHRTPTSPIPRPSRHQRPLYRHRSIRRLRSSHCHYLSVSLHTRSTHQ